MPSWTRANLVIRVKDYLRLEDRSSDEDSMLVTNDEIIKWLESSRRKIRRKVRYMWPERIVSRQEGEYAADAERVDLSDIDSTLLNRTFLQVEWRPAASSSSSDNRRLLEANSRDFSGIYASGTPVAYSMEGEYIRLRPKPTVAVTLTFSYTTTLSDLAADGSIPTELAEEDQEWLALDAAVGIAASQGAPRPDLAAERDEWFDDILAFYETRIPDSVLHETREV